MRKRLAAMFFLLGGLITACSQNTETSADSALSPQIITITGSSTIAPLASSMAKAFEKQYPEARINVQSGGSSRGIADVRRRVSGIGMVSRKLRETENDLKAHLIAYDGIALITHKSNSLENITTEQVRQIYLGRIQNWKLLGGDDHPITVIHKAEGRSTLEVFLEYFNLQNSQVKPDVIIGENEQAIKLVMENKDAVAYVSIGTAEFYANQQQNIKLLKINGVVSDTTNVKEKIYPISRELNFVTTGPISRLQQDFLSFAKSSDSARLIRDHYFVPSIR